MRGIWQCPLRFSLLTETFSIQICHEGTRSICLISYWNSCLYHATKIPCRKCSFRLCCSCRCNCVLSSNQWIETTQQACVSGEMIRVLEKLPLVFQQRPVCRSIVFSVRPRFGYELESRNRLNMIIITVATSSSLIKRKQKWTRA